MNRDTDTGFSPSHLTRFYGWLAVALGAVLIFSVQRGMVAGNVWHDVTAVAAWCTTAAAMMYLAYRDNDYACFGKDENGRCSIWYRFVLVPYLIPLYARQIYLTRFTKEDKFNRLAEGVWVGRRPAKVADIPPNVPVCVDLAAEFSRARGTRKWDGRYVSFPILEASVRDINELVGCIDDIDEESVFIHCAQGHGRTGFFAAAFMLRRGIAKDVAECERLFAKHRPGIKLRVAQKQFLDAYQDLLRKKTSR